MNIDWLHIPFLAKLLVKNLVKLLFYLANLASVPLQFSTLIIAIWQDLFPHHQHGAPLIGNTHNSYLQVLEQYCADFPKSGWNKASG